VLLCAIPIMEAIAVTRQNKTEKAGQKALRLITAQ